MSKSPQEYARELFERIHTADPMTVTHADIGKALRHVPGIVPTRKTDSMNIRGRVTSNQEWRKI